MGIDLLDALQHPKQYARLAQRRECLHFDNGWAVRFSPRGKAQRLYDIFALLLRHLVSRHFQAAKTQR